MQAKAFIIPIVIIALVGFVTAPPAQAELATVTALLAAGFITTVLVVETVEEMDEEDSLPGQEDPASDVSQEHMKTRTGLAPSAPNPDNR